MNRKRIESKEIRNKLVLLEQDGDDKYIVVIINSIGIPEFCDFNSFEEAKDAFDEIS